MSVDNPQYRRYTDDPSADTSAQDYIHDRGDSMKDTTTTTIDEVLPCTCNEFMLTGKHVGCTKELKQALLQWVLEVIGEDETNVPVKTSMYRVEVRNGLKAEQRAKLTLKAIGGQDNE